MSSPQQADQPTPERKEAAREPSDDSPGYAAGSTLWHSSEEDGGPDVGIQIGLGGGYSLYVGELADSTLEDHDVDHKAYPGGWWITLYGPKEQWIIGNVPEDYIAQTALEHICGAIQNVAREAASALASPPTAPEGDWVLVLKTLSDAADQINGEIDKQTYAEKAADQFEHDGHHEYAVTLTAGDIRAMDRAICKAQDLLRLAAAPPPPQPQGEKTCQDCGGHNPVWFAPNALWNLVMGGPEATDDPGGIICPVCFTKRAETAGEVPTAWVLAPETPPQEWREQAARIIDPFAGWNGIGWKHGYDSREEGERDISIKQNAAFTKADAIAALGPPPQAAAFEIGSRVRPRDATIEGVILEFNEPQSGALIRWDNGDEVWKALRNLEVIDPSRDHDPAVSALGWRPTTERPQTGRKFVALYNDGSGARLFYQYEHGLIECEGDEFEELGDEHYGFWAYVPDNYRFWCEDRDEDPIRLPPPPAENDLSGRTAKPTDHLTVQDEPSSSPQADTAALVEALKPFLPITIRENQDYAEITFGEHQTQAMTMSPQDWLALNDAALANHRAASQGSAE